MWLWVIFKIVQGISLLQAVAALMAVTFTKLLHLLLQKNLEPIKYKFLFHSDMTDNYQYSFLLLSDLPVNL